MYTFAKLLNWYLIVNFTNLNTFSMQMIYSCFLSNFASKSNFPKSRYYIPDFFMKGVHVMLTVLNSRQFPGKKDPSKLYYVVDLMSDEDGQIVTDMFVDRPYPIGSKVDVKPYIRDHKLSCTVYLVAEKK